MNKVMYERRRTFRYELRTRVQLCNDEKNSYQNAHLENLNYTGMYLITRSKLAINQKIEIAIPGDPEEETIKIRAKVVRLGNHRSWGLFSYGCHILHSA